MGSERGEKVDGKEDYKKWIGWKVGEEEKGEGREGRLKGRSWRRRTDSGGKVDGKKV